MVGSFSGFVRDGDGEENLVCDNDRARSALAASVEAVMMGKKGVEDQLRLWHSEGIDVLQVFEMESYFAPPTRQSSEQGRCE